MDNPLILRVASIKNHPDEMNAFIEEYKPFIASCVQKYTGRFVEYGRDDELSIGLLAFHEAINFYDERKGNFLIFANHVIKRRLIDYYRKQKKYSKEISIELTSDNNDHETDYDFSEGKSIQNFSEMEIERTRKIELEELKRELKEWDLDFFDVAQASPKQEGTKKLYAEIIKYIVNDEKTIEVIITKKYLPIARICDVLHINRKKVERGRNYIIAAVLIMVGDYEFIREFVSWR